METEAAEEPQQQPEAEAAEAAAGEAAAAPQPEPMPAAAEAPAPTEAPTGDVAMADAAAEEVLAAAAEPAAEAEAAAEPAAEAEELGGEPCAAPASALRKRKSVRFHVDEAAAAVHHTPEGAARDATITIRLRKGDLEQVGVEGCAVWGRACPGDCWL